MLFRDLHVVENQFCRGRGADAQLVVVITEREARHALFYDEGADAPGALARFRYGEYHVGIGLAGVGDEDLVAVPTQHC